MKMNRAWKWYNGLSKRIRVSINYAIFIVGLISTIMSVIGVSLNDWTQNFWVSLIAIFVFLLIVYLFTYWIIGCVFKDTVSMTIRQTTVSICCGNIFEIDGLRVIGCYTHFDTRVDDIVISQKSLHGKLVLKHGKEEEIKAVVEKEALRMHLSANSDGLYDFPLGTIIRYDSSKDNKTYLLLAMTELNDKYEAHSNMAKFEHMLMKMWTEINRVYASNDVAIPLLGTGISRFDDGPKDKEALLKCMLCTLNNSGVTFNSNVKIVISGDAKDIPFYEFKDMFRSIQGR